jgi:hypothetical protein
MECWTYKEGKMTVPERAVIEAAVEYFNGGSGIHFKILQQNIENYLASQKDGICPVCMQDLGEHFPGCVMGKKKIAEIEPLDWGGKMFRYPEECQKLVEAMCDLWRKQNEIINRINKQ